MPEVKPSHRALLIRRVLAFVVICLVVNGLIFSLGWNDARPVARPAAIPPGPVVGAVWTVLFAGMGAAYHFVRLAGGRGLIPIGIALLCLSFPFYTAGLSDQRAGYWGTVGTMLAVVIGAIFVRSRSPQAAWLLVPVAVWTGYVSVVGAVTGRI